MDKLKDTGRPIVLTVNGKAEIVLQDAASYQEIMEAMEYVKAVKSLKESFQDIQEGKTESAGNRIQRIACVMKYQVSITATAKKEIREAYLWIKKVSPGEALKWLQELFAVIQTLKESPTPVPDGS